MGLIAGRALPCIWLLTLTLLMTAGCARLIPLPETAPMETPLPGMLFLADHRHVSLDRLGRMARQADYILIGESHTNPCDHQFQKDALAALAKAGLSPGLGLEMVPWSKQDVLDAFNQGSLPLDQLEEKLVWPSYWGYSFELYRPVLEQARTLGMPLVALNTPKELQNQIRSKGLEGVPEDKRGLLPSTIIFPAAEQNKQLEEEYLRHAQMMPSHAQAEDFELQRFLLIQSLWDTQMAHVAATWRRASGRPMVILAGAGHVDHGHGIAHRLSFLDDNPRILSLSPWRGGKAFDPAMADLYFFCPEASRPRLGMDIAWKDDRAVLTAVLPGSRADEAGLMAGDVLLKAEGNPVSNLDVLHQAGMTAASKNSPLRLEILRNNVTLKLEVPIAR